MEDISREQLDALREMVNIGMGQAAGVLNEMVNAHVDLQVPELQVYDPDRMSTDLECYGGGAVSAIRLTFDEPFSGSAILLFSQESAANLVNLLVDDTTDSFDMDTLRVGTLQEVGNIVLNTVLGTLGDLWGEHIQFMPPEYFEEDVESIVCEYKNQENRVLYIKTFFGVEQHELQGEIIFIFRIDTFQKILTKLEEFISS